MPRPDVPDALKKQIAAAKAKAGPKASGVLAVKDVPGIVVDDEHAKKVGDWTHSTFSGNYIGSGYVHDGNAGKGEKTLTFQPEALPPGRYEVRLAYSPGTSRADNVPIHVFSADGEKTVPVDMKKPPPLDGRFFSLGEYRFEKNGLAYVMISNEDTKGHVTADAVVFVRTDGDVAKGGDRPAAAPAADAVKALEAELKRLQFRLNRAKAKFGKVRRQEN